MAHLCTLQLPILASRFIMNLRSSVEHSGLSEDEQVEANQMTITSVVFKEASNAIEELGRDVDDGFSESHTGEPATLRHISLTSQSIRQVDRSVRSDGSSVDFGEFFVFTT